MPAGCEFACVNEKCKQYKSGFIITSPWPMGKIELVINSKKVKENNEVREHFIKLKDNGEKYAVIQLPNTDETPIIAYKVSLWSDKAKCIYSYPVETVDSQSLEESIKNANLPEKCEKTGCQLKDFDTITKEGINCPYCGEKLQQNRWFTNGK